MTTRRPSLGAASCRRSIERKPGVRRGRTGARIPRRFDRRRWTMATLTVLAYATAPAADDALGRVRNLHHQQLVALLDAAVISWVPGEKNPSTRQIGELAAEGAPGGMFWATLFGLIFFTPLLGMGIGMAMDRSGGALKPYGIDDDFIRRVRAALTGGTSALFLMTAEPITPRFVEAMNNPQFNVIAPAVSNGSGATAA